MNNENFKFQEVMDYLNTYISSLGNNNSFSLLCYYPSSDICIGPEAYRVFIYDIKPNRYVPLGILFGVSFEEEQPKNMRNEEQKQILPLSEMYRIFCATFKRPEVSGVLTLHYDWGWGLGGNIFKVHIRGDKLISNAEISTSNLVKTFHSQIEQLVEGTNARKAIDLAFVIATANAEVQHREVKAAVNNL